MSCKDEAGAVLEQVGEIFYTKFIKFGLIICTIWKKNELVGPSVIPISTPL